jgi:polyamine oxidase
VEQDLVDINAKAGYRLINVAPETPQEMAAEYYAFDSEYGQPPEVLVPPPLILDC